MGRITMLDGFILSWPQAEGRPGLLKLGLIFLYLFIKSDYIFTL